MAAFDMRFQPAVRERLRRRLIERRARMRKLLDEIVAGKDRSEVIAALQGLGLFRDGVRPATLICHALDQVERRRILLISGDERFGRCDTCGAELEPGILEDAAWADQCVAHAQGASRAA